jgi:VanZ family protein
VAWSLPTFGRVELAANVVLLVAPALLAAVVSRRPLVALAALSALSALVETVQAVAPALGRSCSTDDWLSNTIGVVVGVALGWLALRLARVRRLLTRDSPSAPTRDPLGASPTSPPRS